jgi:hypothetical protein
MANISIKGGAVQAGLDGLVLSPTLLLIENLTFTPRYSGPVFEVEDDQGLVRAFGLQTDGGDISFDATWINNNSTGICNLAAFPVGGVISMNHKAINGGTAINATIVAMPEVKFSRKTETKLAFKTVWRPNAVA